MPEITVLDPRTREKTARPKRWTVVFVNDDFTTVDFVIDVLTAVFNLSSEEAVGITMDIHRKGRGNVGLYSFEVAETKAMQAMDIAKRHGHPLTCHPQEA